MSKLPVIVPLHWPSDWPRTRTPRPGPFDGDRTLMRAAAVLMHNLTTTSAGRNPFAFDVTITCGLGIANLPLRMPDGTPIDQGACVYFKRKHSGSLTLDYALPCDTWARAAHNMWALALHVNALRGTERWGVGSINRVFEPYRALHGTVNDPPPTPRGHMHHSEHTFIEHMRSSRTKWWDVLGVHKNATRAEINTAFTALALYWHPDVKATGDAEVMKNINRARDEAFASDDDEANA